MTILLAGKDRRRVLTSGIGSACLARDELDRLVSMHVEPSKTLALPTPRRARRLRTN